MSSATGQTITVCGNVFRLVETIGRGSYGTVHKAINLSSGAAVAVKMIGKDKLRRPHERQSIEKEIETMRVAVEQFENGHPHIVRLLCTKESQQHIFIVQEYCAGGDIAQLMKTSNGLTEEQARLYMSQLASGLQFLRSQNVVHRDLKPANLLLSSRNMATAKLKIADFGFARELESEMMAESVVGSPLYMAPELLEYKSYDAKADLWSVGIILYEMLANEHPFLVVDKVHATNHLALRRNIYRYFERYGHVRVPKNVKVSPECEQLVEALLRVDPRRRISFEDFFRAPFLLPPAPSDADVVADHASLESSETKQPLVAEKLTWAMRFGRERMPPLPIFPTGVAISMSSTPPFCSIRESFSSARCACSVTS
ncbi:protein kinase, putative [Phytophthora infestans T30-4]|uniref:Protein kinase, putative n=1 Tax=Phytophthora infestans (strain T30-4) TaxID=403677 RepID=D0N972_PHYIT|nr:protein kinase, putative [Phytophthora infestans T30-4]EEY54360.1 protein kinase, putative [Phytophthora infestans T30-4]|eukprot:XP_002904182.1 protein kinase, putative [Phytophthora infestans T30-4]